MNLHESQLSNFQILLYSNRLNCTKNNSVLFFYRTPPASAAPISSVVSHCTQLLCSSARLILIRASQSSTRAGVHAVGVTAAYWKGHFPFPQLSPWMYGNQFSTYCYSPSCRSAIHLSHYPPTENCFEPNRKKVARPWATANQSLA